MASLIMTEDNPFFDVELFGEPLVTQLKRALTMNRVSINQFWDDFQKEYNRVIYVEQDMRHGDQLNCLRVWFDAQCIIHVNMEYAKSVGKPPHQAVGHQTKFAEEAIQKLEASKTKEYPIIKHFKNEGQGPAVRFPK